MIPARARPLRALHLVLTDECNFRCGYCYRRNSKGRMAPATARKAVRFFLPRLVRRPVLLFYGGEPLLAFDVLRDCVEFARSEFRKSGRRPRFGLTTNGSLASEEIVAFLERHRFRVELSFDGAAQDLQRSAGSAAAGRRLVRRLVEGRRVVLETNSVFTPRTLPLLADSLIGIVRLGVPAVRFGLSLLEPWGRREIRAFSGQMDRLVRFAAAERRRTGKNPFPGLAEGAASRIRTCGAAGDRAAVDTRGRIWGCALLSDWSRTAGPGPARRFSMGRLGGIDGRTFEIRRARVRDACARLAMDWRFTAAGSCLECPAVEHCWICPVNSALSGGTLETVPAHACALEKAKAAALRPGSFPRPR